MKQIITWSKTLLKSNYTLQANNSKIGELKGFNFQKHCTGFLGDMKINFETIGTLKPFTKIINTENDESLGEIHYNFSMSKARIEFHDRICYWKYDNMWNTKWSIYQDDKPLIKYYSNTTYGFMEFNEKDELLCLTGLFISNYYLELLLFIIFCAIISSVSLLIV